MMEAFDPEVLQTALARKPVLGALADTPHHRKELQERLDLSKTTCHRIIRTFDERGLLRRTDRGYELTQLGHIVYEQADEFESAVKSAYRLQPLAERYDTTDIEFKFDLFRDARVTTPEPGNPYPFVDRTLELFRQSDTIRVIDCNPLVPPMYVEKMLEIALETGMQGEFIVTEEIALGNMAQFPDLHRAVAESDTTAGKYFVYDDIPFGLAIYDDHLDLRVYDDETGTPTLYADTDNPAALDWARGVFAEYTEKATPAPELDAFPDWAPDTGIDQSHE